MSELFEKCSLGGVEVKNRFVRSATCMAMADEKGHLTDRLCKVYEDLAAGGVGLIISGYTFVMENEQPSPHMTGIYDDSFIEEYKNLTAMVHSKDAKIAMQIVYGGGQTDFNVDQREIWGPSAVADKSMGTIPKEMTHEDIERLIEAFAQAALRAKNAGFDAVQIHAAHGYLLSRFLTPYYNRRTDEYGGDIENRARIIYRIFKRIKELTGQDYPVFIKMHCDDFMKDGNGFTFQDSIIVAARLSSMGINAIEFSGGNIADGDKSSPVRTSIDKPEDQSYFSEYVAQIADFVDCDVVLVGGNRSIKVMKKILDETRIGFFALSRPLVCEADLINKWQDNHDYKPECISCNKCYSPDGTTCILKK